MIEPPSIPTWRALPMDHRCEQYYPNGEQCAAIARVIDEDDSACCFMHMQSRIDGYQERAKNNRSGILKRLNRLLGIEPSTEPLDKHRKK